MLSRNLAVGLVSLLLSVGATAAKANAATTCADLAGAALADGKVTAAAAVVAGAPIALGGASPALPAPAAFCRVQATLTPTPTSEIKVEVWLPPVSAWNGKLLGAGNGGFGGSFFSPFLTMQNALPKGYATAGTDLGHTTTDNMDAGWALGKPEKIKDFAWRANHLTALAAKALIADYYGTAPTRSYFQGCSDGGREALMEAERFPDDYEGVIAGAPANAWTHLMSAFAWGELASRGPRGAELPTAKLAVIQAAALAQCAALDPLKDGYLDDPRLCRFDVAKLRCNGADGPRCLTDAQLATLRKLYRGPVDPRTGAQLYPGYTPGAEAQPGTWDLWITGPKAQHGWFANAFFKDMVFDDAGWKLASFDFERDVARADREMGPIINSNDPNLAAFKARGGKLILYHGWSDAAVPPKGTIAFYEDIRGKMGGAAADSFVRLFMVPGMGHCLIGPGPNTFDALAALEHWTEHGIAPEQIVAAKYGNDLLAYIGHPMGAPLKTRPLCAYPKVARWKGAGAVTDAANFTCEAPRRTS